MAAPFSTNAKIVTVAGALFYSNFGRKQKNDDFKKADPHAIRKSNVGWIRNTTVLMDHRTNITSPNSECGCAAAACVPAACRRAFSTVPFLQTQNTPTNAG